MTNFTPLLLISPDGMLGRAVAELLTARGLAFEALSYPQIDLRDAANVANLVRPEFKAVINCSAYTNVDGAEANETEADGVNALGVANLAARCKQNSALLVHYSTDYVFDGNAVTPYRVDEPRNPQNAYGRSKAKGEAQLIATGCEHIVIRTSWLYAPWGKNFVDTIARYGKERPVLRVVDEQRGRPTSAQYLAERSLGLLEQQARGIFHVTDGGECSWFEFATAIVRGSSGTAKVEPCSTAELKQVARRPPYSVLDLSATEALLGPSRPWQENLEQVLRARDC